MSRNLLSLSYTFFMLAIRAVFVRIHLFFSPPADTNCATTFTILHCLRDLIQTEHWSHSAVGAVVLNGITAHIHEAFVVLLEVYGIFHKGAAVTNRAAHCVKNMEVTHHVNCDFEFRCLSGR